MILTRTLSLLLGAWLALPAWAAGGQMLRDDNLRASASATSAVVGKAAKGSQVEVLTRKGGWTQIRAAGKTGWVRLLSVRAAASEGDTTSDLGGVVSLTRKREPGKVVAVAGLRGLNEEELRSAKYDAQELKRLDSYGVSLAEARGFAADAGLTSRSVGYLPGPQREQPAGSGWSWGGH